MINELLNKLNRSLHTMKLEGKIENLVVLTIEQNNKEYILKKELYLDYPLKTFINTL